MSGKGLLFYKVIAFLMAVYLFMACVLWAYAKSTIMSLDCKVLHEVTVGPIVYTIIQLGWPYVAGPAIGLCPLSGFWVDRSYLHVIPDFCTGVSLIAAILWLFWSIVILTGISLIKSKPHVGVIMFVTISLLNLFFGIYAISFPSSWGDYAGVSGSCCPPAHWHVMPIILHSLFTCIIFRGDLFLFSSFCRKNGVWHCHK